MTKSEPLKGKVEVDDFGGKSPIIDRDDVKSALEWMIAIHEERIEELVHKMETHLMSYHMMEYIDHLVFLIGIERKAIMILEEGLSDVI